MEISHPRALGLFVLASFDRPAFGLDKIHFVGAEDHYKVFDGQLAGLGDSTI